MKLSIKTITQHASILGLPLYTIALLQGAGVNSPTPSPGKSSEVSSSESDGEESASQEEGGAGDCSGCSDYNDPNNSSKDEDGSCPPGESDDSDSPSPPSCIKEIMPLALVPNEQDLPDGALQLYIEEANSNLGSRKHLEFFGMPFMRVDNQEDTGGSVGYEIQQASGVHLKYKIAKSGGAKNWTKGSPTGTNAYVQSNITYSSASGTPSQYFDAARVRQHRAAGGFVEYPKSGGRVVTGTTRKGRVHDLQNMPVEIIREDESDGSYSVELDDRKGFVRQVKTIGGFIDIVPLSNRSYEVRKYAPEQVGILGASGLYQLSGDPYRTMHVTAPDDDASKLIITKTYGSKTSTTTHTVEAPTLDSQQWNQNVSAGGYAYKRTMSRGPKTGQPGYRSMQMSAKLTAAPNSSASSFGTGYSLSATTYNYRPVYSKQSFEQGKSVERSSSYKEGGGSSEPVGRKTDSFSRSGAKIEMSYTAGDSTGNPRMTSKSRPFSKGGASSAVKVRNYSYTRHVAKDKADTFDYRPRTRTDSVNEMVVRKTLSAFYTDDVNGEYVESVQKVASLSSSGYGAVSNRDTVKRYYSSGVHQGRLKSHLNRKGVMTKYSYVSSADTSLEVTKVTGLNTNGDLLEGKSTRTISLKNPRGFVIEKTNGAYSGGEFLDFEKIHQTFNPQGKITKREREDLLSGQMRVLQEREWDGGLLIKNIDAGGVVTHYEYNGLGVRMKEWREAVVATADYPAQPEIVTTHTGTFHMTQKKVPTWKEKTTTVSSGNITNTSLVRYDSEGRVEYRKTVDGYINTRSYNDENTVKTTVAPNGTTEVHTYGKDEKLLSVTGSSSVPRFYHYQARPNGGLITTMYKGVDNGARYTRTETDALDRTISIQQPGYNGAVIETNYTYGNVYHGPISVTTTGSPTRIYEYDELGSLIRSGVTADDTSLANASATDVINEADTFYQKIGNQLWAVSRNYTYPKTGDATKKLLGGAKLLVAGFTSFERSVSETFDIEGNVSSTVTSLDRASKLTTTSRQDPRQTTPSLSVSYAGRLMSVASPGVSGLALYGYDALGRQVSAKDPRHTGSYTKTFAADGNLVTAQISANGDTTGYSYYAQGELGAGRVKATTLADNSQTFTTYNAHDLTVATWGSQTYTRWNTYDVYDQLVKLHTWKVDPSLNTDNFVLSTPTVLPTGSASTTWNYENATGLLQNKRYNDGNGTDYTYDAAGRLATREWQRLNTANARLKTTYVYDDRGRLASSSYNDTVTAPVTYSYDRLGRPNLVTQGAGNTANQHAYLYNETNLMLDKETISYGNGLSRSLDRSQDGLLRPAGFQLMNGTTAEHATSYGYDAAGRLAGVHTGATYPATPDFSYNYLANSGSLLESVTGPAHTVTNSYEANRNVLQQKRNTAGDSPQITNPPISNFIYSVNALGQRDDVSRSGSAFASANTESWNYNAKGEVVTADHSSNNAFDRAYEFDGIGNRVKSADSLTLPTDNNYKPNALNQLTNVDGSTRTHDEDGNLTDDGTKQYTWDAENRLTSVKQGTSILAEYAYDFQSRRISKFENGSNVTFVYDGWNPIAEYEEDIPNSSFVIRNSFTWGADLSGSMQGAGGVGGLLAVNDGASSYYPTYDGNGNVSEYVDATGAVVAHYEYDAFGRTVAESGAKAADFSHRFSTKPKENFEELYYYGYRFYDAELGRWLNRDPIQEFGGFNIYALLSNNTPNTIDVLGHGPTGRAVGQTVGGVVGGAGGFVGGGAVGLPAGGVGAIPGSATGAALGAGLGYGLGGEIGDALGDALGDAVDALDDAVDSATDAICDYFSSRRNGKGERNYDRHNPNPDKKKTRDPQTGKKLPKKPDPTPPQPEVPTIPRGKKK